MALASDFLTVHAHWKTMNTPINFTCAHGQNYKQCTGSPIVFVHGTDQITELFEGAGGGVVLVSGFL